MFLFTTRFIPTTPSLLITQCNFNILFQLNRKFGIQSYTTTMPGAQKRSNSSTPKASAKKKAKIIAVHPGGVPRFSDKKVDGVCSDRARFLAGDYSGSINGGVLLWLEREKRVNDNWALLHAMERARKRKVNDIITII